jgi:hypothetical protein
MLPLLALASGASARSMLLLLALASSASARLQPTHPLGGGRLANLAARSTVAMQAAPGDDIRVP